MWDNGNMPRLRPVCKCHGPVSWTGGGGGGVDLQFCHHLGDCHNDDRDHRTARDRIRAASGKNVRSFLGPTYEWQRLAAKRPTPCRTLRPERAITVVVNAKCNGSKGSLTPSNDPCSPLGLGPSRLRCQRALRAGPSTESAEASKFDPRQGCGPAGRAARMTRHGVSRRAVRCQVAER